MDEWEGWGVGCGWGRDVWVMTAFHLFKCKTSPHVQRAIKIRLCRDLYFMASAAFIFW
jgi:hypothetical protein